MNELTRAFACQEAVLAYFDRELERVFYWRVPAGFSGRLKFEGTPATRRDAFLLDDLSANLCWNSFDGQGEGFGWDRTSRTRLTELPRFPGPSRKALNANSLLAAAFRFGGEAVGRLLLLNGKRKFRPADLRCLERVAQTIELPLENLYRLRHLRARAVEAERSRISLDLHDGVLQTLLGVEIQLGVLQRKIITAPEKAAGDLGRVLEMLRSGREELRQMVTDLRPLGVESADLLDLMRGYAERFRNEAGIGLDLLIEDTSLELSDRMCRELFQIYREALANVKKHAGATHVVVKLWQNDTKAYLVIDDNGKGFSFAGRFSSDELDRLRLGPISIKERTRSIGGLLTVESNPGHGARLTIEIPLN
jgi:signal transduction histidine kinase